jgi:hypothetical protein
MGRSVPQFAAVALLVGLTSGASLGATQESVITVTTRADAMNGDVTSVERLRANPGPDGISLREAMEASNNDPGTYAIRFAPSLRGSTITVVNDGLPELTGGGVAIDGDITGDGRPDVTLRSGRGGGGPALTISSGGNTLHALALDGFFVGVSVVLAPVRGALPTGQTFAGNTLSRLVIEAGPIGIYFAPSGTCERRACVTGNTWRDLRIVGNTIETSTSSAIGVNLLGSVGDRLERVTIERNTVRVSRRPPGVLDDLVPTKCVVGGNAIDVVAGAGGTGERRNTISDVVVSGNVVTGGALTGIRVTAGADGADSNVLERVRVVGNRIDLQPARTNTCMTQQIIVSAGDYALFQRGKYATDNVARDIEVSGNSLRGNEGVRVFAGGAGGARNAIRGLRIARNTMNVIGPFSGVNVNGAQGGVDRPTTSGRIADVVVDANRIVVTRIGTDLLRPAFGGISVIAGDSSGLPAGVRASRVERVRITNNVVGGPLVGISLVGGFAFPNPEGPALRNVLANVVVSGNRILRPPATNVSYEPGVRAIRIAGGIGNARGNRVSCVRVRENDAVSVASNPAPSSARGAAGNSASRAC